MDPTTTYRELVMAQRRGDDREAREYATALSSWIDRGGFLPCDVSAAAVASTLAYTLDPYGDVRDGVK